MVRLVVGLFVGLLTGLLAGLTLPDLPSVGLLGVAEHSVFVIFQRYF